jgi:nucleoside-diphosphate-sugar epimerase
LIGAGDVAKRLASARVASRAHWYGLARSPASAESLRTVGILPIAGDLDQRASLARAAAIARAAHATLYLAPPPNMGEDDARIKRWLAATSKNLPRRLKSRQRLAANRLRGAPTRLRNVYVSTTGVYGDRAGDWVNETTATRANSARAKRRVSAEARIRKSRKFRGSILRAPGIYAASRLPVERLRERVPTLLAAEDVFTNHIHADDLAYASWLAMFRGGPQRTYNVVDDASLKMGEYFDTVADALSLPRPPRMTRAELSKHVTPMMLSFMSESRRIHNHRMKQELRIRLKFATPETMLASMKPEAALQRTLI